LNLNEKLDKYIINEHADVLELLERQEKYKLKTFFIITDDKKILGTVSDGDFRRYVLKNKKAPIRLSQILQKDFFHVCEGENVEKRIVAFDLSKGAVPILNDQLQIVDIYNGECSFIVNKLNDLKSFCSIAPARISFAGGGSDVANWFKKNDGKCINAAIDVYARVNFEVRNDNKFIVKSINTGLEKILTAEQLLRDKSGDLIFNCLRKFPNLPGLNLTIYCDFTPGSGLGGSSSLCVAILQGCAKLTGAHFTYAELQALAYEVERIDTKILGGWQDQIAAVHGGLLLSTFGKKGIKTTKIHLTDSEQEALNSCLFLFKVGDIRSSSKIHAKLNTERKSQSFKKSMLGILKIADELEDCVRDRDFRDIGDYLDKGWQEKRRLSSIISNSHIDNLYDKLLNFGASGGRLLGAGGSGYLMMFVDLPYQGEFLRKCSSDGIEHKRVKLDMLGARIIGVRK
jgi:D-glycero-alpha-D-manno-heptose-7-phosphate kinase